MQNQPPPPRTRSESRDAGYRPGVGVVLFNRDGHVLIAERIDNPGAWQMPQGGIDEGENPELAVFREMQEEIGTRNARIIGTMEEWIHYDFPPQVIRKFHNKFRGQRQKWIALRFLGQDSEIRLDAHHDPEFSRWQWVPIHKLLDFVVPFKRGVYERVIREFSQYAVPQK